MLLETIGDYATFARNGLDALDDPTTTGQGRPLFDGLTVWLLGIARLDKRACTVSAEEVHAQLLSRSHRHTRIATVVRERVRRLQARHTAEQRDVQEFGV